MQESMMQGCKETCEATNTKWDHYSIFDFLQNKNEFDFEKWKCLNDI